MPPLPPGTPEARRAAAEGKREGCGPDDRVFGGMVALTRYPLKLIWYENYAAELYDLSWDAGERIDLAAGQPEQARALAAEAERRVRAGDLMRPAPELERPAREVPEALETLRALGYLD